MSSRLHKQQNLAVLIDAQNIHSSLTPQILRRAACYGVLAVKRAYADWSRPHHNECKRLLSRHSVEAVQLFHHVNGKNSVDIAMILDAVKLSAAGVMHGFCLASSDSDFAQLAQYLRGQGRRVYGFGARHTPEVFVQACTRFIYVEDLVASALRASNE